MSFLANTSPLVRVVFAVGLVVVGVLAGVGLSKLREVVRGARERQAWRQWLAMEAEDRRPPEPPRGAPDSSDREEPS